MAIVIRSGTTSQCSTANQLAGAAKTAHHLVADQQDAVAVAQRAHALQVPGRRDDDPVGAGDGLQQDGRDRLRAFVTG